MEENNCKLEDFSIEETKDERSVFSSINDVHSENVKPGKNNLMNQIQILQCRVNNLNTNKRKTPFACPREYMQRITVPFPREWGNMYIPVQTNFEITGKVLIEISDKSIPGCVLPEIFYKVKKKLGCIFVKNHNLESLLLKRGQTIGLV